MYAVDFPIFSQYYSEKMARQERNDYVGNVYLKFIFWKVAVFYFRFFKTVGLPLMSHYHFGNRCDIKVTHATLRVKYFTYITLRIH